MAQHDTPALQLGSGGTSTNIGTVVTLRERNDGKQNMFLSSPLDVEININNNNAGADRVLFTAGSGGQRKVIALLDVNGNLWIAGTIRENASL